MHVCIWIKVMVKLVCFIAEIINSANNFNQKAYVKAKSTTQGIPRWPQAPEDSLATGLGWPGCTLYTQRLLLLFIVYWYNIMISCHIQLAIV